MFKYLIVCLLGVSMAVGLGAQTSEDMLLFAQKTHPNRLRTVAIAGGAAYTLGMAGLYAVWYRQNEAVPFQFFDDWPQWQQMDKFGHWYSSFQLSRANVELLRWAGMDSKRARWWGGGAAMLFMTSIEVFDGFSPDYGASWTDAAANFVGAATFVAQDYYWGEVKLYPKFSFRPTPYAAQRPQTLGRNWSEQWLKDYNGQTYWLTLRGDVLGLPPWLGVSAGYGAEGMLFGRLDENRVVGLDPYRRLFLSLDIVWEHIPTRRPWLKTLFYVLNTIKIPAPALEWRQRRGFVGHGLYY